MNGLAFHSEEVAIFLVASWENGTTLYRVQHELIPKAGGESKIS